MIRLVLAAISLVGVAAFVFTIYSSPADPLEDQEAPSWPMS